MPSFKDITGQKIRNLTAVRRVANIGRYVAWEYLCDCGNKIITQQRHVYRQKVTNCGCVKEVRKEEIVGKRFGRLVAIKRLEKKRGRQFIWVCVCDCGKETLVPRNYLTSGNTRSCGCLKKENIEKAWQANRKEFRVSETKEYKRDFQRKKLLNNKLYVVECRIRANLKNALKKRNIKKAGKTFDMLGYSPNDLFVHIEKQFLKGMSWENIGKWHIDHIIPLNTAKNEEDLIRLNHFTNLRPLWARDNLSKGKKRTLLI